MTRSRDVSAVQNNLGVAIPPAAAGKNAVINGGFDIWQRGTSFSTNNTYTADRWYVSGDGAATFTLTQQTFTAGSAPVSGYEGTYFARYAVTSAGGSTYRQFQQRIEDVRTFAGQTVTVSFWARINSGTVTGSYVRLNQNFGSGGSAVVGGSSNGFTLTASWQRFTATVTLPSISGKTIGTGSFLEIDTVMPFTTSMSVDFWGVQVEAGSTATPFQTATGTKQGELAACQRYLPAFSAASGNVTTAIGYAYATNACVYALTLPVTARVAPTGMTVSGSASAFGLGTAYSVTPSFNNSSQFTAQIIGTPTIVAGQGSRLEIGNSCTILFTGCEL